MGKSIKERVLAVVLVFVMMTTLSSGCLSFLDFDGGEHEIGKVSGLTASNNSVYIELDWEALENADHYLIYRDGKLLAETNTTTYVDGFVDRPNVYFYQVSGVKKEHDMFEGVEGEPSSPVEATLTAPDFETGFVDYVRLSMHVVGGILGDMGEAGQALDYHQVGDLAVKLEFCSSRYINESRDFQIEEEVREEYQMAMHDFKVAAEYFGMAADSFDYDYIETGEEYVQSGYDHADNVTQMIL